MKSECNGQCAGICNFRRRLNRRSRRRCGPISRFGGIDFAPMVGYTYENFGILRPNEFLGEMIMQWTAPAFEEVCLNCEINSYASAKL